MINRLKGALLALLCLGSSAVMAAGYGDTAVVLCSGSSLTATNIALTYDSDVEQGDNCAQVLKDLNEESLFVSHVTNVNNSNNIIYTLRYQGN